MGRSRTAHASDPRVWVNGRAVTVHAGSAARGTGPRVVVRFTTPLSGRRAGALTRAGGAVAFWCPPSGACVTLADSGAAARIGALPFVAGFVPFEQDLCDRNLDDPGPGPGRLWLDVICFSAAERPAVARALVALGGRVLDQAHAKIRLAWTGDPSAVRDVVGVKLVERPRVPQPLTAPSVPVGTPQTPSAPVGTPQTPSAPVRTPQTPSAPVGTPPTVGLASDIGDSAPSGVWIASPDGSGEILAVNDTGLDTGVAATVAADVAGRVRRIVSWPINPSWAPFVTNPGADDGAADRSTGHGTYVTGVAAGDGAASAGAHRGVAPGCRIVFQAIEQFVQVAAGHPEIGAPGYRLAGRPTDLRDLFARARALGARIQVNAWGTVAHARYDNDCYEADLFLSENRDTILLFAAGNEGSDADGNRRIDPGSLESPAAAKNVLTVGATEGSQTIGFTGTWSALQGQGRVFGNAADRADPVAGQPDRMALLSSAGPTYDGRIKPDVCAPGTDVVGPRSSVAPGTGWGPVAPAGRYMVDGGTSVAVAVAGGAVTVLRQAWRAGRRRAPSGPTLKALVVLGTAPVRTRDGTGIEDRFVAGFGRIDVAAGLPVTPAGERVLLLADSTAAGAARAGSSHAFAVTAAEPGPLRAVLCWYDAPGEHLVNNLNLSITGPGIPAPVWGNHPPGQPGFPDLLNTVEVIDLESVAAGTYRLVVTGVNVPSGRQPYSLVVRGRAISPSR